MRRSVRFSPSDLETAGAISATRKRSTPSGGGSLLARGLTSSTPVVILSDNSVNHALLALDNTANCRFTVLRWRTMENR
ncbi:MAG TPA: hypothetical protein VFO74_02710 [Pseudolabrys sp.]|nr:hypothetical protein [Pseudolabrys sp.]